MRPRKMAISGDAPTSAMVFGDSSAARLAVMAPSSQAQTAGDDAAQDLGGPALDGQLGSGEGGVVEQRIERRAIGRRGVDERGEVAGAWRQGLLPGGPEVLDDRAL